MPSNLGDLDKERLSIQITVCNSRRGRSPRGHATRGCCPRWAPFDPATTTTQSSTSGHECKSNYLTDDAGTPASSELIPSGNTLRVSTYCQRCYSRLGDRTPIEFESSYEKPSSPLEFHTDAATKPEGRSNVSTEVGALPSAQWVDKGQNGVHRQYHTVVD